MAVRTFVPDSQQAWLIDGTQGAPRPMRRIHPAGFYEAICSLDDEPAPYRIRVAKRSGEIITMQ